MPSCKKREAWERKRELVPDLLRSYMLPAAYGFRLTTHLFLIVIPVANKVKAPCWNHVLFHVTFDKLPESRIMKCLVMTRENLAIFVNVDLLLPLMFYLFSKFSQTL